MADYSADDMERYSRAINGAIKGLKYFLSIAERINNELGKSGTYFNNLAEKNEELKIKLEETKNLYTEYINKQAEYRRKIYESVGDQSEDLKKKLEELYSIYGKLNIDPIDSSFDNIANSVGKTRDEVKEFYNDLKDVKMAEQEVADGAENVTNEIESSAEAMAKLKANIDVARVALRSMWEVAKRGGNKWIEFQDTAFKNARAMGKSRSEATAYFKRSLEYTRELGRRYGLTHEQIVKFQTDYTEATGKAIDLTKEQTKSIAAMGTLSSPETASKMADEMDKFGGSIEDAAFYMQLTQERAKILGLNPKKAAESIAQNMKLASTYTFKNGIDGMARMAIEAQRLRVSMESVVKATENFDDIEKAISNSAKIQMLGGSFAANYSNPMGVLYESLNDPEAFMKRMEKTLAGKGVFNRATGQVDVAAIDRRFIKEYANYMGMSFEEAMTTTQSLAKNREVEAALKANKATSNFTDAQTAFIQSQAQWDAETQQFKVTDQTTGEQIALKDLTAEKLKELQGDVLGEKEMWGDVRDIRDHLLPDIKARQQRRALETTSTKENINGFKGAIDAMLAKAVHPFMQFFSDSFSANGWLGKLADVFTFKQPAWLGAVELMVGRALYKSFKAYFNFSFANIITKGVGNASKGIGLGAVGRNFKNFFSKIKMPHFGFGRGTASAAASTGAGAAGGGATAARATMGVDKLDALRRFTRMKGIKAGASALLKPGTIGGVLKSGAKRFGPLAALIGAAEVGVAYSQHSKRMKEIENSNLSEADKTKAKSNAKSMFAETAGGATGSAIGGVVGASIGSIVGPLGTVIGGVIGGYVGNAVGKVAGRMFGYKRTDEEKARAFEQHNFETEKMGVTGNEPLEDIQYKAAVATIGIHDLMITNYNRAKGLREDGTRKGFWERIDGWFGGDEFANGGIVKPLHAVNGAIIPGEHTIGDHVPVMANSGEMILNRSQQSALFSSIKGLAVKGPEIRPLSSIGQATNFSSAQSTSAASSAPTGGVSDINLNVSGTIRLEGGGNSANLDINSLLNSPQFKRQITDLITNRLNESSNGGKKNLESYRNNMAGQYNKVGR